MSIQNATQSGALNPVRRMPPSGGAGEGRASAPSTTFVELALCRLDDFSHDRQQGFGAIGLDEDFVSSRLHGFRMDGALSGGGQHEDGQVLQEQRLAERPQEFDAVKAGHVEIEHQDIGQFLHEVLSRHQIDRVESIADLFANDVAAQSKLDSFERSLEQKNVIGVILNKQNPDYAFLCFNGRHMTHHFFLGLEDSTWSTLQTYAAGGFHANMGEPRGNWLG
jgi:hypothetical protein